MAVSVTVSASQYGALPCTVTVGFAGLPAKIVSDAELVQPCAVVVWTEYEVNDVGATVIVWVVSPVDQRYDAAADAVSVTGLPGQGKRFDAVMTGGGAVVTVTPTGALVALQPLALVTVTP